MIISLMISDHTLSGDWWEKASRRLSLSLYSEMYTVIVGFQTSTCDLYVSCLLYC